MQPSPTSAVMSPALQAVPHPYFDEISLLFYNYRLAHFNRLYLTAQLERVRRKNLWSQVSISVFTGVAVALFSLSPSFPQLGPVFGQVAAVLSALAFLASIVAPIFGWNRTIDEFTARIQAWQIAGHHLESALRFLHHTAGSKHDAELQVKFADEAYRTANNLPETDKLDLTLAKEIRLQVENAIPPGYVWTAL